MSKILLFIPVYNCEKQIPRVLSQLSDEVCSYLSEVIIIDNRSTDHSETTTRQYLQKNPPVVKTSLLRNDDNYGLGGSHKVAFDYAVTNHFDYIIVLHGDDQGNICDLLPYIRKEEYRQYDCFLGARFMKTSRLQGYSRFRTAGNYIYNILYSLVCGYKIYDLGSGLNMYNVSILENRFYMRFTDNLIFNCCMLMGGTFYRHRTKFFPISWREDDQISNVKMMNQAVATIRLLGDFMINRKEFVLAEHRDKMIKKYTAKIIYTTGG